MKNLLKLNNFKILIDLLASFFLINFIYFIIKDFTTQISIYAPKVNILIILYQKSLISNLLILKFL